MYDLNAPGRTLAKLRDGKNISQYELADEMQLAGFHDMTRDRIMNIERGRSSFTICELAEFARICETHQIEFPPSPTCGDENRKRRLAYKVIVTVQFPDAPKPRGKGNRKKK